ncbi:MAG: AAA family ATPase, partial [Cyanobacteria bacterium J06631_9]
MPPHQRKAEIPERVSAIVLKLMAKNAEDRYQSALGIQHDLENCLHQLKETDRIEPFELAQQDVCDRFLIPEKLYGRQKEVNALLAAFEKTANGSAEMMLVAGFSGIGKTAVVNEVHKPITRRQGYFVKGKFDQFNRNLPLSAFVQALRGLMKLLLSESEAQLAIWRTQILAAVGDNGQLLIDVIPELAHIIGKQSPVAKLSGAAAQNRFNRLFQKFVGVFATSQHPLVVFLDDLQWADAASLHLLEQLLGQREQGYLFIIGAYRDNEVSAAHPLMLTLNKLDEKNVTLNTITLAPLSQESLNELIADTLQCAPVISTSVTQLIYQKTNGNPFFSTQFLKSLHEDKLITFDWETGLWQCDVVQIKQLALTDDVVEFMAGQLQKFTEETQTAIELAACIGNQFDLATLAIVHEHTPAATVTALWPAIQAGLIIPTSEVYKFYQVQEETDEPISVENLTLSTYRFLHDRVQQAAYSLIPEGQKQKTHFKVGQRLSQTLSTEEQSEKLFEIVNQLNFGETLVTEPVEKEQLVRLNLAAGRRAKMATAYSAAMEYFSVGRRLLPDNSWKSAYKLTLALYEELSEVAYLNGDFEQSAQFAAMVLEQATSLLDQTNVYVTKIQSSIAQEKLTEAIQIALPLLTQLEESIYLPESPTPADFEKAFIETQASLAGRTPAALLQLPEMQDPRQLALMQILGSIAPPAYLAAPALMPLIDMKMVNLSVKYGNTPTSAFGYAMYGFLLCGVFDDIESGYAFGQLSADLVDKFNAQQMQAKVLLLLGHFINLWKEPLYESLQQLPKAFQAGLASGDLEFAGYATAFYCYSSVLSGKVLDKLDAEIEAYQESLAPLKQGHVFPQVQLARQVMFNLLHLTDCPDRIAGDIYDESVMVPLHEKTNNRTSLAFVYIAKLRLAYLFEGYEQAAVNATKARPYLDGVMGMPCVVWLNFYESLTLLARWFQIEKSEQPAVLEQIAKNQEKMKFWADFAPMNWQHLFDLVMAERDRVLENRADAIEHYDRAIAGAVENNCLQDEALANELTAKFYLAW